MAGVVGRVHAGTCFAAAGVLPPGVVNLVTKGGGIAWRCRRALVGGAGAVLEDVQTASTDLYWYHE
jgi:hypothetical protein